VFENFAAKTKDLLSRRRVLLITPVAFGGLYALFSRRETAATSIGDVTIAEFNDRGEKTGEVRRAHLLRSDAEWRKVLTNDQFYVARRGSTDTPFTGTYYKQHGAGIFHCICCAISLFSSETKFDSGTGWPSFWAPLAEQNIRRLKDTTFGMERVEVRCALCDAHLGHVFDDGPPPTGERFCLNESSLRFLARPADHG
jgi:peptide-methionine (R)-S-oxide reductase